MAYASTTEWHSTVTGKPFSAGAWHPVLRWCWGLLGRLRHVMFVSP